MMANEGTGFPGQIQGREPDTKKPEDIYAKSGAVYVAVRYFATDGTPTAQGQMALEASVRPPTSTGANASVTLTSANTAYSVPSSPPASAYVLVLYNGSDTDMYWGYQNTNANGILLSSGDKIYFDMGASQPVYLYCASGGKVITLTTKIL